MTDLKKIFPIAFIALLPIELLANVLPARRSDNYDPYSDDGRFDLRARVDGAVDFYIRGNQIRYEVYSGRPPRDEGSEYRSELPAGPVYGLELDQRDGRNRIRILEYPSRKNRWTLVLRIDDPEGGDDRYHARITWEGSDEGNRNREVRRPGRLSIPNPFSRDRGELPTFRSDNYDPYSSEGRFDLRARVDGAVTFFIRGDRIRYHVDQGSEPLDEGSEYRREFPSGEIYGLELKQRDGRNPIHIIEYPSRRNGWTLVVRIEDPQPGNDRYHARIVWEGAREHSRWGF